MSGVDYQAVPTSPDLEAAGARNLALLAADASDLNANEAKPRHDAAGRQPKAMKIIMTMVQLFLLSACCTILQACCTMTLICAFVCLLLWVLALTLSSFPWMLALLELPAYIAMCWLFQRWWHALFKVGDDAWMVIVFAIVAAFLPVGTFAFIRTSGSEACQWCWYGQWSRAFTPLVLMLVYNATEVCALAAAKRHQLLSRGYFLSRLLVAAVLLVAPMLLVLDIEAIQAKVEVVDLRPSEYVNVTWHNAFNVSFAVNKTHLHWLQMPHPVWPTQSELARAPATRNAFWLCYMLSKFVVAGFFTILMLKCRWSSSGNRNQQKGDYAEVEEQTLRMAKTEEGKLGGATENVRDESRSMMLFFVLGSHLVMCSKVCISAGLAGQLTAATGLAFEGYDLCLSAGLLWLLAQAVAVRFVDVSAEYSTADVCMTMLFLVPFVGDGFDSLKDAMLASVAMNSDNLVLKCLGWGGLVYLFVFHMALLCIPRNRLELQRSYLPVFFLKRRKAQTATEAVVQDSNKDLSFCSRKCLEMQKEVQNLRRKVLAEAYKMTAPARQWAMIIEDAPQGILAAVISLTNGFRLFTVAVNIFVPSLRIVFSWLLHDRIAWAVQGWMLQEALDALDHDRFEVCDEFLASLCRLRLVFPERELVVSLCKSSKSTAEEVVRKFLEFRPVKGGRDELDGPEAFVRLMRLELLGREGPGPSSWGKEFIEILKQLRSDELTEDAETIAMASRRIDFTDWGEETLALLRPSPTLISKLTQITILSLDDYRSLQGLGQLTNLTSVQIQLQANKIGSKGCRALGEGLAQLKNLTSVQLQLQENDIGSEGCRALGEGLAQLKNLTSVQIQLQANKIGSKGCRALGEGLAQLKNLLSSSSCRRTTLVQKVAERLEKDWLS